MKTIKVKCPAKINYTLEVLDKREDGFHNIQSIMQAVNLYDVLTVTAEDCEDTQIILSGTSCDIPYDSRNLVHKAAVKFLEKAKINNQKISIHIEKNIPIEAGLAGGSTDAAGTFIALNNIYDSVLSDDQIEELCASLGSDLNFCLHGGTALCSGRGEKITKLPFICRDVTLIKPKCFGISAKEAYTKFSLMKDKTVFNNTDKLITGLKTGTIDESLLCNSLETAVIDDYEDLATIKNAVKGSMMSGSGPTFFVLKPTAGAIFDITKFLVIENLKTIGTGVEIIQ